MAPPTGKGKDLSRMSAPGKDLSRMSAPPAAVPAPVAPASQPARLPSPSPRSGKPKGKDFSRMTGPPAAAAQPLPAPVAVAQAPPQPNPAASNEVLENIRRQNAARVAAGMKPIINHPSHAGAGVGVARPPGSVGVGTNIIAKPVVPGRRQPANVQSGYVPPQHQQQQPQPQPLMPNPPAPRFNDQQQLKRQREAQQQQAAITAEAQRQAQILQQQQQQQQQQQKRQQPIAPPSNASANAIIRPPNQSTPQPYWSESRLSTTQTIATISSASFAKKIPADGYGKPSLAPIIGTKLQSLCNSIDPSYNLDSEVQERLVEMADSFVDKVTKDATKLARHRGSSVLDVADVALALKKGYNMEVPGLGAPSVSSNGAGKAGGQGMGGWLFADKVNPSGNQQPRKKQKVGGTVAAAAAM